MGLFSFLKNVGSKKLVENEAAKNAASEAELKELKNSNLEGILRSTGIPVNDIDVEIQDETVVVYGQAKTQEDKEKLVLILGNIDGVSSVDDRISVVEAAPEAVMYEVKRGDSLSKIAKQFYGDPMKYTQIFEANKPMLSDPNKIYPGQVLRIPQ